LTAAGFDATAEPGEKSQFDVRIDEDLLFSKQQEGRFPEADEILDALRS
jgi:predicted Rdx family selenoprotein